MKELYVFPLCNTPNYYIPILLELKKIDKNIPCIIVGELPHQEIYGYYYYLLRKAGVKFISSTEYMWDKNHIWFIDYISNLNLETINNPTIKKIVYTHSLRALETVKFGYQIFSCERHLKNCLSVLDEKGNYDYDKPILLKNGVEFFVGGFYHLFDIMPYINMEKKELQEKLEKKIGITFNKNLPIISYLVSDYIRDDKFVNTMKNLSSYYNIFIKNFLWSEIKDYHIKNVFCYNAPNESLFRFVSDYNIVPITSGAIVTNFALELPTIPVYSNKIAHKFPFITENKDRKRSDLTMSFSKYIHTYIPTQVFEYYNLVPPISIEDSDAILELTYNKTFWNNFKRKVRIEKEKYFGKVILEDSVNRTAKYVLDILTRD